MRIGGRCSRSCVIAGATKTTRRPAAQPKRTIEATPNTKESETPPVSTSSTGTGKRSARVEALRSAASPSSVVALCGVTANDPAAAHATPSPATQTGTRTARSRGGGRTRRVTTRLPVEVVSLVDPQAAECNQDEREGGGKGDETRTPVQQRQPPHETVPTGRRRLWNPCRPATIPRKGEPLSWRGSTERALSARDGEPGLGQRPATPGELLAV